MGDVRDKISQGYRTAIGLQGTVQGNIEGGQVKGGDTGEVWKKELQRRAAVKDK